MQILKTKSLPHLFFLAILLSVLLITPVMAAPATKIPVTAYANVMFGNIFTGISWTKGEIYHTKGAESIGTVTITADSGDVYPWTGTHTLISNTTIAINQKTGTGNCHNKVIVIIKYNDEIIGTFEGSQHGNHEITPIDNKLVDVQEGGFELHGTGEFKGLKMKGAYNGYNDVYPPSLLVELYMNGIVLSP